MKRLQGLWFVLCLALLPLLHSCDDNDGYSVGDFTPPLWATVRTTGNAFYLDCDVWGKLWPVNTDMGWFKPVDGQRVIASFNPLSDRYGEYDHAVKILEIQEVLTKSLELLTPENDDDFGHDAMRVLKNGTGISGGYFNVLFQQNLPSGNQKHRISLVRPENQDDLFQEDGYLHLQLRYNGYNQFSGTYAPFASPVSFSLRSLDVPEGAKGIKIHLKSEKNGDVELVYGIQRFTALELPDNVGGLVQPATH